MGWEDNFITGVDETREDTWRAKKIERARSAIMNATNLKTNQYIEHWGISQALISELKI